MSNILNYIKTRRHNMAMKGVATKTAKAIAALSNARGVRFAEPNYIVKSSAVSNDPYYTGNNLWGMYGDATTPTNQYGSQAGEAWASGATGSRTVYVGDIDTGIGFLDHMLESFSRHSGIDLKVRAQGDLHVDFHHTTEDTGIVIGEAVSKALGDRVGGAGRTDHIEALDRREAHEPAPIQQEAGETGPHRAFRPGTGKLGRAEKRDRARLFVEFSVFGDFQQGRDCARAVTLIFDAYRMAKEV